MEKFIFESEGELFAQDENLLFLWHVIKGFFSLLPLSSHCLLPISTTRTHTKANTSPQPKKTNPVFMLLLSLSPSGLLLLLRPSVVLLFSLHGIASQVASSEQYVVPFQL